MWGVSENNFFGAECVWAEGGRVVELFYHIMRSIVLLWDVTY